MEVPDLADLRGGRFLAGVVGVAPLRPHPGNAGGGGGVPADRRRRREAGHDLVQALLGGGALLAEHRAIGDDEDRVGPRGDGRLAGGEDLGDAELVDPGQQEVQNPLRRAARQARRRLGGNRDPGPLEEGDGAVDQALGARIEEPVLGAAMLRDARHLQHPGEPGGIDRPPGHAEVGLNVRLDRERRGEFGLGHDRGDVLTVKSRESFDPHGGHVATEDPHLPGREGDHSHHRLRHDDGVGRGGHEQGGHPVRADHHGGVVQGRPHRGAVGVANGDLTHLNQWIAEVLGVLHERSLRLRLREVLGHASIVTVLLHLCTLLSPPW